MEMWWENFHHVTKQLLTLEGQYILISLKSTKLAITSNFSYEQKTNQGGDFTMPSEKNDKVNRYIFYNKLEYSGHFSLHQRRFIKYINHLSEGRRDNIQSIRWRERERERDLQSSFILRPYLR